MEPDQIKLIVRDEIRGIIKDELTPVRTSIDKINVVLTGNGTPERGHSIRIDRLEQREQARTWWVRTAIGAAIGAVLTAATAIFK